MALTYRANNGLQLTNTLPRHTVHASSVGTSGGAALSIPTTNPVSVQRLVDLKVGEGESTVCPETARRPAFRIVKEAFMPVDAEMLALDLEFIFCYRFLSTFFFF